MKNVSAVIVAGDCLSEAELRKRWIEATYNIKTHIGIHLANNWKAKYILYTPFCTIETVWKIAFKYQEKFTLVRDMDTNKCKVLHTQGEYVGDLDGILVCKRRKGDINSLFDIKIGKKLLKQEKSENLIAVDFVGEGKSYVIFDRIGE